jgi:hypothetical protein
VTEEGYSRLQVYEVHPTSIDPRRDTGIDLLVSTNTLNVVRVCCLTIRARSPRRLRSVWGKLEALFRRPKEGGCEGTWDWVKNEISQGFQAIVDTNKGKRLSLKLPFINQG